MLLQHENNRDALAVTPEPATVTGAGFGSRGIIL